MIACFWAASRREVNMAKETRIGALAILSSKPWIPVIFVDPGVSARGFGCLPAIALTSSLRNLCLTLPLVRLHFGQLLHFILLAFLPVLAVQRLIDPVGALLHLLVPLPQCFHCQVIDLSLQIPINTTSGLLHQRLRRPFLPLCHTLGLPLFVQGLSSPDLLRQVLGGVPDSGVGFCGR